MKYPLSFLIILLFSNISFGQNITYSSSQKYQNIRLEKNYSMIEKRNFDIEPEKTAKVKLPFVPFVKNKKEIYGAYVPKEK